MAVRPLAWHGPATDPLAMARSWVTERRDALTEPLIDVANIKPSLTERRQMGAAGQLEELYAIELREGWQVTEGGRSPSTPVATVHA